MDTRRPLIVNHAGVLLDTASAVHHTATVDTAWDGPAQVAKAPNEAATLRYMHAWRDAEGEPDKKGTYKFPHHAAGTDTAANLAACRNGLARLSGANIPDGDRAGVKAHLQAHLDDGDSSSDQASEQLAAFRARTRRPVARQGHSWYRIRNTASGEAEIFLFDEIGFWGTSADEFVAELKAINAARITVRINSPGGDVADGLAIYNALRAHPAHITTRVDGLAASAASFIFQAGDRRVTARNGILMIHDALALWFGNAVDMRKCADLLDKLSDNIADIYAQHGGGDVAAWRDLMLAETWFTGAEAVTAGLADEMTDPDPEPPTDAPPEMRNSWDLSIFRFAGRDQAPAPVTAHAPGGGPEPGGEPAPTDSDVVVPPPEPAAEPEPDDTSTPPVQDPPDDTTWADLVAQLDTTAPSTQDALASLREAHSE